MTMRPHLPFLLLVSSSLLCLACESTIGDAEPGGTSLGDNDKVIVDGNGNGNSSHLSASCPPADLFGAALCVCEDFVSVGSLRVSEGPAGNAIVGVNGRSHFVHKGSLSGGLVSYGSFENVGALELGGSLSTAGNAIAVGELRVAQDVNVGGDMTSLGDFELAGALRVQGKERVLGSTIDNRASYQAVEKPCACEGSGFFDVGAAVLAAKDSNDNAAIGLDTELVNVGTRQLRLETGSYYLSHLQLVGDSEITIAGEVSLYVDGDIQIVGRENIQLEDGATLDLFVSGNLHTAGNISFGSEADPLGFRLYVGGADTITVSVGAQEFFGSIYAPSAKLAYVGGTTIVGSLFAKSLTGVGSLDIQYGSPAELDPPSCEPEPQPQPETPNEEEPEEDGPQID